MSSLTNSQIDTLIRDVPGLQYDQLTGAPEQIIEAMRFYDLVEGAGSANNPMILSWAKELGHSNYTHDAIPWCSLFVQICTFRAGHDIKPSTLMARSWLRWGRTATNPGLGSVLVFWRGSKSGMSGHVGFYLAEDKDAFFVFGGNQGDKVKIARIAKSRLLSARNPVGFTYTPQIVSGGGSLSENEA